MLCVSLQLLKSIKSMTINNTKENTMNIDNDKIKLHREIIREFIKLPDDLTCQSLKSKKIRVLKKILLLYRPGVLVEKKRFLEVSVDYINNLEDITIEQLLTIVEYLNNSMKRYARTHYAESRVIINELKKF